MKHTVLIAISASMIIGTSAQASLLTNDALFERFGEETYLNHHASPRVDMASMEIQSNHGSIADQGVSLNALHNILGEETYSSSNSMSRMDMASMEIRRVKMTSERGLSLPALHEIFGEENVEK